MPDVAISPATNLPTAGQQLKKPLHLIELVSGKTKEYFLTTDKPEFLGNGFVVAKGFYFGMGTDFSCDKAIQLVSETDKEEIEERYFPHDKIFSIKNLFFKAK